MKKILIIYNKIPRLFSGGDLRVFNTVKQLSLTAKVTLLVCPQNKKDRPEPELIKLCQLIIVPYFARDFGGTNKILNIGKRIFYLAQRHLPGSEPRLVRQHNYQVKALKIILKRLVKKEKFDFIQVEHSFLGPVLKKITAEAKKIIVFHNLYSSTAKNQKEKKRWAKYENRISSLYNLAVGCSQKDTADLKKLGYRHCRLVPNGVDTAYFQPLADSGQPKKILFVGDMTYSPNTRGVVFFLKKIYPLLTKMKFEIIGEYRDKKLIKSAQLNPDVTFRGFQKDIRPFFPGSIFICPLLEGGGTRIKILTAMAMGIPVVSTSKGAEGIAYNDGENIIIADQPDAFAGAINNLSADGVFYQKISAAGRQLVEAQYRWQNIFHDYLSAMAKSVQPENNV